MNQIEPEFLLAVLIEIPADAANIVLAYERLLQGRVLQQRVLQVERIA